MIIMKCNECCEIARAGLSNRSISNIESWIQDIQGNIMAFKTKEERKAYVFGLALHTLSDYTARSTYEIVPDANEK